jgi:oligoribonuclease (3'-5' exoribonuclease)
MKENEKSQDKKKAICFFWLDLETTGLDPKKNKILEASWCFDVFLEGVHLVKPSFHEQELTIQEKECLHAFIQNDISDLEESFDPIAKSIHEKSGLWEIYKQKQESEGISVTELEKSLLSELNIFKQVFLFVYESDIEFFLSGSSINFDKSFLLEQMPLLAKKLHYRVFDVSVFLLRDLARNQVEEKRKRSSSIHRSSSDLVKSRFYGLKELIGKLHAGTPYTHARTRARTHPPPRPEEARAPPSGPEETRTREHARTPTRKPKIVTVSVTSVGAFRILFFGLTDCPLRDSIRSWLPKN